VFTHVRTMEPVMIADLDTLLTALYVELTDRIIPARGFTRRGPGKPPEVTDAELVCIAVAQVLLRFDDERHWLRAAASRIGHLFPRLLHQSEYKARLNDLAPQMEAALRWLVRCAGCHRDAPVLRARLRRPAAPPRSGLAPLPGPPVAGRHRRRATTSRDTR